MNKDHIFITLKILVRNIVKIMRLLFTVLFITYFVGQYWLVFVQIISIINSNREWGYTSNKFSDGMKRADLTGSYSFLYNQSWDFLDTTGSEKTLIAMYYALTSLSTTGFGDLYPQNTLERFLCSFMLLGGVTIFSYFLSELQFMIQNFEFLNGDIEYKDELETFFVMLKKFNFGQQLDEEMLAKIRIFMNDKWAYDKNNFLITENDKSLLNQLPSNCQTQIYKDFLFRDFL